MLKELGANLSPGQLIPYFKHLSDPLKYLDAFLGVCNMLKLVRNNWAKLDIPYGDVEEMKWDYLVNPHELQESRVHMANKHTLTGINKK